MFKSKEVKKAYRTMAKKYHPDKVDKLPESEQGAANKKWLDVVRSYETLTEQEKFDNWLGFGNDQGSPVFKNMDNEVPTWMFDPRWHQHLVLIPFGIIVVIPFVFF